MQTFLEYFKGDPLLNPNFKNGKNPNRVHTRKHANTQPKTYKNMHPSVEAVARGQSNNVTLMGPRLQQLLKMYNITFQPGTKGLGRTHAVLVMSNNGGVPKGVITRK